MARRKYTAVLVSRDSEAAREFSMRRQTFRLILFSVVVLLILLVSVAIYVTPKVLDYNRMKSQHQTLMAERMKVAGLLRDLNRIKAMNSRIEKALGIDLELAYGAVLDDSAVSAVSDRGGEKVSVSFLDNIPSYMPVEGFVTQEFSRDPLNRLDDHLALDIAARSGSAVHAAASGLVVFSGWTYQNGNLVIVSHGDGYFTFYGHNQKNLVEELQMVDRGDLIALVGESGIATGPHLHFEVWKDGRPVDPAGLILGYGSEPSLDEPSNGS